MLTNWLQAPVDWWRLEVHIWVCAHTHPCMQVQMHVCAHTPMHAGADACVCADKPMHAGVDACVCVLTHPCMQVWKPMTIFSLADHLISDT